MRGGGAARVDPLPERFEVLLVRAEAQELQPLGIAVGVNGSPAVRMTVGIQLETVTAAPGVEAERAIEPLGRSEVRHAEGEVIERMNAQHVIAARRDALFVHDGGPWIRCACAKGTNDPGR